MASEEHKRLAQFVKEVHSTLRNSAAAVGAEHAWTVHCSQTGTLEKYAKSMEKLATEHWDKNFKDDTKSPVSRIDWAAAFCYLYFKDQSYVIFRLKEADICNKINTQLNSEESFNEKIKLLDVGSCYNPFKSYSFFEVLALDLCPANDTVLQCDFCNIKIGDVTVINDNKVFKLAQCSFEVVTFCFLLEYLPTPAMRVLACENAYKLLKPGGLLIISTPDSKHVGANCKIMKCWRYTMACMGFSRVKYEKCAFMHCMAFRKALKKETAVRWADLHKEPYYDYTISIPQDRNFTEND